MEEERRGMTKRKVGKGMTKRTGHGRRRKKNDKGAVHEIQRKRKGKGAVHIRRKKRNGKGQAMQEA